MSKILNNSGLPEKNIVYVSTYPPRECGIATFTKDLIDAVNETDTKKSQKVIAVNEKGAIYTYDKKVKFIIERDNEDDYIQAAEYVNDSDIDVVNLQHEFGIFGGNFGEYINIFLDKIKKPVITTLHTVQIGFEPEACEVLKKILQKSEAAVVIAHNAVEILKKQELLCKKFAVIPHGCPFIPFVNSENVKASMNLKGKFVVSTFGLISKGKGIEYAVKALASVVDTIPEIMYLIIGETHPEVRKNEGEKYRKKLLDLVYDLGLEKNVRFHNRFLPKRELIKYLQATDVYVTPYISPNQISSGTLVYALGAGRAIISTPYLHAQEVLAENRGLFCKFKDSKSIADCLIKLSDDNLRKNIENKAYKYSRRFLWSSVAKKYEELFSQTIREQR